MRCERWCALNGIASGFGAVGAGEVSIERDGDRQLTEEWSSRLRAIATHSCGEELERTAAPQRAKFTNVDVDAYVTLRGRYVEACVERSGWV